MDALAAFGSLIVTEGATAPAVLAAQTPNSAEVSHQMKWTAEEQAAADALFASQAAPATPSPAAALFVATVGAMTLKEVVLDQRSPRDEEEKESPADSRHD